MLPLAQRSDGQDELFMRRALAIAGNGWGQVAPNPMVGAIVVRDGRVVGEGWHSRFGAPHAEVDALAAAGPLSQGGTVYVTLEPCNHTGKTPPCVDALINAGVKRVVAATPDPSPVAGGGAARLRAAGVHVTVGVEEAAARELMAPFLFAFSADRPWVTLKLALSLDGAVADASRSTGWLTSPSARREVHHMRSGSDAVGVGLGTVRADNPALTVRNVPPPRTPPMRVVFTRRGELPLASTVARTATEIPTVVVGESVDLAHARALMALGVEILAATTLSEAMRGLRQRGVRSLLVEGGSALAGALLAASLVDRLVIFQAPVILGAGSLKPFEGVPAVTVSGARRLPVIDRRCFEDDQMTTFALRPI